MIQLEKDEFRTRGDISSLLYLYLFIFIYKADFRGRDFNFDDPKMRYIILFMNLFLFHQKQF